MAVMAEKSLTPKLMISKAPLKKAVNTSKHFIAKTLKRVAVAALFTAVASAGMTVSGASEAKTLRVTLQLPLKNHLGQNISAFKEQVEKESGGSLTIEIYPSAQLYKDSEVPQAVASGSIEMGIASITRFAGTVPAVDIFYVPFLFDNQAKVEAATAPGSTIRGPIDAAILKTGARILWWQAYGGAIMLSKGDPIRTPADMKGKKVRVFGKTLGKFVETLGGAPTLMSGSKQFLAYQRGTVDAARALLAGRALADDRAAFDEHRLVGLRGRFPQRTVNIGEIVPVAHDRMPTSGAVAGGSILTGRKVGRPVDGDRRRGPIGSRRSARGAGSA